ncbi:MAG: hypothetical protein IJA91_00550 [Clostridia bacterium]|nr:hypothetical protein [Clostridia bacterium]
MRKLIIIAVIAFLVLSGTVGTIIGVVNTPENVAARALSGALEELEKRDEIAPLTKILSGGSVTLSIEDDGLYELMGTEDDMELGGKIYFSEDAVMMDELLIKMGDQSLSGSIYFSEDKIYVENEEILNGAWGLERGDLADTWADSLFDPDSDSEVAMDKESFDMIYELFKALDENVDKELQKDLEKVIERYQKQAWKLVRKYAEFDSVTDEIRLNGQRKDVRLITVTLDSKAVAAMVEDMCNYILDDKKLEDLVEEYSDRFADMLKDVMDWDDITDAYDELLKQIEDNMDDILDEIEDGMEDELVISIATPKASSKLLMFKVSYDRTDYVSVEFGHKGIRDTDCITIDIHEVCEVVYEITEDSKKNFEAELSVNDHQIAMMSIDKDSDEYELELVDLCTLKGIWETKSGVTRISIDTVKVDDEKFNHLGIVLTFDEKDKMPAPAKSIESILSIDEKDIEKWAERLEEFAVGLGGVAYPDDPVIPVNPDVQALEGPYTNGEGVFIEFYKDETFYAYIDYGYDTVSCTGYYAIAGNELYFSVENADEYINEWEMLESSAHTINGDGSIYIRGLRMFRYVG